MSYDYLVKSLQKQLEDFKTEVGEESVGEVIEVGDGIAKVSGLSDVMSSEMLEFETESGEKIYGVVLNLEEYSVGAIIFGQYGNLKEGDKVTPDDLPERFLEKRKASKVFTKAQSLSSDGVDLNTMLDEIENNMIVQALEMSKGVKSKAASLLGLNRTTLIEKMKKKSIDFHSKTD